jgi:hypothetical protein
MMNEEQNAPVPGNADDNEATVQITRSKVTGMIPNASEKPQGPMTNQSKPAVAKQTVDLKNNAPQTGAKATMRLKPQGAAPQPAPGAPAKSTIRLTPQAAPAESQAGNAAKSTIRLTPQAAPAEPQAGNAAKSTIRLTPNADVKDAGTQAIPSRSTIKLSATPQSKSDIGGDDVPTVAMGKVQGIASNQTVKLSASEAPTIEMAKPSGMGATVKLTPSGQVDGDAPTIAMGKTPGGPKPSSPTVKLSAPGAGGAKPSSPTVKLKSGGSKLSGSLNTSAPASSGPKFDPTQSKTKGAISSADETSKLEIFAVAASFLLLTGTAVMMYLSYSELWMK